MHFYTDRNYNCGRTQEFDNIKLYNIVGADLEEKGKILQLTADIFSDIRKIFFHSPCERSMPCALYMPELNVLAASSYNNYMAERMISRTYDIGIGLSSSIAPIEEIVGYTMNQSGVYMKKLLDLLGIADILLKEYIKNGDELLKREKLRAYIKRKLASMLEVADGYGKETRHSVSAITCSGYRFAELPENFRIIRLVDRYISASRFFVKSASEAANKIGYDTIVSAAVDSENAPLHLMIPEAHIMFVSETPVLPERFSESQKISMERFYIKELLASREHTVGFYGEYIRKIYNEAALCARICMDIKSQGRKLLMPFLSERSLRI